VPFEVQIIRASEFIRFDPREHLDFEASKEALRLMARACRKRGIDRAVLDLRPLPIPAKPLFTRDELSSLVETFHDAGFTRRQRLAVLYRQDPHQGVRKFAFISTLQGWHVRAFCDFEKALAWLSDEDIGERQPEAQQVPIRAVKRKLHVTCD
jgi:hypothetical protein